MGSAVNIAAIAALLLLGFVAKPSSALGFTCSSSVSTCQAMVGYVPQNKTTLNSIRTLFSIADLRTLLAANNLPDSTPGNRSVSSTETIRIPFKCSCKNKTGTSDHTPAYIVKGGDTLDDIASKIFSYLVTYMDIAKANSIRDPDVINKAQNLTIPLPCSCDEVSDAQVLHYGHVVAPGSNVSQIASQFGTTETDLLTLNGMANASLLQAYQVLDVPLKVCNSSVKKDSVDYPLLVPNDTYVYTANDCVKCSCNSIDRGMLKCVPSGLESSSKAKCSSLQCTDSTYLGSANATSCNTAECSYTGYYPNSTISVQLTDLSTCANSSTTDQNSNKGSTIASGWKLTSMSVVSGALFMFMFMFM